ncbi:MAG: glucuronate isomerase [Victivallales bacterium]|nr:glucuronate isomerase [Victivallales bacterium]
MKEFMSDDFMLNNEPAVKLYNEYAGAMPIIDYHCHLNPQEIAEDKKYRNITEIWLGGDHYKWRLMRACGVAEKYITGDADAREKFQKWAETIPKCIGNPLYHWTHLELKRYFAIDQVLCPENAEEIWTRCNEKLRGTELTAKSILKKFKVKVVCTTDDPADSLEYHKQLSSDRAFATRVLPGFRPDKAVNIDKAGFAEWIALLEKAAGTKITSLKDLEKALGQRLEFFNSLGCKVADHGLDTIKYVIKEDTAIETIFRKGLQQKELTEEEVNAYKTHLLIFFGTEYARLDWAMQLHFGVLRNVNRKMFGKLGPDTGFDAAGDYDYASDLALLLNALEEQSNLPRTILYSIDPTKNIQLSTICGCFNGAGKGKMQLGTAWWFNDHKSGMEAQIRDLAQSGVLGNFIGMLTDSRSFLSFTRHEYFRRILCNLIGGWIAGGELPADYRLTGQIVQDICYNNAADYFKL